MDAMHKHSTSNDAMPEYRIGKVAKELDLGPYTLKHYERAGLIDPATSEAGFRFYTREDFGKIISIRSLRRLGFSVEEVGELLTQDAPAMLEAMEAKLCENEQTIAELQAANRLLHRHVSSLRNNVERPPHGVFDPATPGLIFVTHFRGDELAGGSELVGSNMWKGLYERSLLGMRVERDAVNAEGMAGCWWGLVPLGDQTDVRDAMAASDPEGAAKIIDVLPGPALVVSAGAPSDGRVFDDLRSAARVALAASGRTLAGDLFAIADSVHWRDDAGWLTLTLRIPVDS